MPAGAFAASGPGDDPESKSRSALADARHNPRIRMRTPMFVRLGPGYRAAWRANKTVAKKLFRNNVVRFSAGAVYVKVASRSRPIREALRKPPCVFEALRFIDKNV